MRLASLPKPVAIMHIEAEVEPKSLGGHWTEAVGNGQGLEVYHGM